MAFGSPTSHTEEKKGDWQGLRFHGWIDGVMCDMIQYYIGTIWVGSVGINEDLEQWCNERMNEILHIDWLMDHTQEDLDFFRQVVIELIT